jgi:hypothetical protein
MNAPGQRAAYLGGTARIVLTALAKAGTATTRDLHYLGLTPVHTSTTLLRLRENGYATCTGKRKDGKHLLGVWAATDQGRAMLGFRSDIAAPEDLMTLARVRTWLAKAIRDDMNGAGAKTCAGLALDELNGLLGAREITGEEAA